MKSLLMAAASLAFLLISSNIGVSAGFGGPNCRRVEGERFRPENPGDRRNDKAQGRKPDGHRYVFAGWTLYLDIHRRRTEGPAGVASDADRVALYNTLAFGTGTYKVEGDKVSLRYDGSWNQAWTGTERVQTLQVSGKVLTWTSASFKLADGKDAVAIFTYERVE